MKRTGYILLGILLITFLVVGVAFAEPDVQGSKDHPLLSRMPGYYIAYYTVSDFGAFDPTVMGGGKEVHWEGKVYSINYYRNDPGPSTSMLQIVRNYEAAVTKIGGKLLGGDERRMTAEIRKNGAMTGVYVEAHSDGWKYTLTIVETKPMKQEVVADAKAMQQDITGTGKTIIYGIYFDTGSAVIKPTSEPALVEIVKMLKASPTLKVYVVGHTDSVGNLASNLKLSSDRAASVVKALVARGIAAARLQSAGVGPYSPVASNDTEPGRAKNRRVEIVKQ